MVKA
ncbi:hypothetical protein F66182_16096, partial [Fusarium sp. NRRL 66182]|jgi:hypothetical protein